MVFLVNMTLSMSKSLSAFLMISKVLRVLMVFLSFKLTGAIPTFRHLRVNLWSILTIQGVYVIILDIKQNEKLTLY